MTSRGAPASRGARQASNEPAASDAPPNGGGPPAGTGSETAAFASGARVLSIGIASTGIFTFAYLATSSHVLSKRDYGLVSLCWSIMFVILSVIYPRVKSYKRGMN